MTKIQIGEVVRDMTEAEEVIYQQDVAKFASEELAATQKAALKLVVLEKLGLTADEVAALLG